MTKNRMSHKPEKKQLPKVTEATAYKRSVSREFGFELAKERTSDFIFRRRNILPFPYLQPQLKTLSVRYRKRY
jgi:RNase adaptor protein for sRNA GlmZ degradation